MASNQKYLPLPAFLIILGAVGFGVWNFLKANPVTPIGINEVTTSGSVSLSLSPSTIDLAPNTDTTISLNVDSGIDRLSVVKFELTYDPTKVTLSAPTKGTWITKELSAIALSSGKLSGELGAQPDSTAGGGAELQRTGTGTLLTFKAKGLTPGVQTININGAVSSAWTVTGTTANTSNMLRSVSGSSLTIANPAPITDLVSTGSSAGKIDKYDYVELVNQYGKAPAGIADFNNSGAVDGADYTRFMTDYGKTW